jgi:aryl-alcohol dehydrogenase-like predicted oxidoreductase
MKYVHVGGVRLSAIGLGAWQFGAREWGYGTEYAEREAGEITRRALDLGVNLIDTAEVYGFGRSERIVGQAIGGRRDEAFIATKLFPLAPLAPVVHQRAIASARRLGVQVIDLYQVHWPNPVFPLASTMRGMQDLQSIGLVRHVGVSNFSLEQWQEAERALGSPVLSNQVQYSLAERKPDRDLVPWAQANDRLVIAYSPLAQGLLSGRYDRSNLPGGVRAGNPLFLPENLERAEELLARLRHVAAAHDATPAQVALAWVLRRPNVVAIPGASSVAQLEANAAAADLELTDDEDRTLTEASDRFLPRTGPATYPLLARARMQQRRSAEVGPRSG